MLLGIVIAASFAAAAEPAFDWRRRSDQQLMLDGFDRLATFCARDFGFTRVPKQPDDVLRGKLEAYLLLASNGDTEVLSWIRTIELAKSLETAAKDDAVAERAADALIAADSDPDSYVRAEALYVATIMEPLKESLEGCRRAARDDFIGKHYLTGDGSAEKYIEMAKRSFAESVSEFRNERK